MNRRSRRESMVLPDKRNRRKKGHRCAPVCEQLEKLTPSHTSESEAECQETSVGLSMVNMKQHGFSVMLVKFGGNLQNFAGSYKTLQVACLMAMVIGVSTCSYVNHF